MKKWIYRKRRDGRPEPEGWSGTLGAVSSRFASLLWRRGISSAEDAERFIEPRLRHLSRPELWPGMREGACLLASGILSGKKFAVWGDYDVDGVTATALVCQVLSHYNIPVTWHLPQRQSEGYGLNIPELERLAEEGIQLLLTVDCGISDRAAVAHARELGMDVVISDHHLPPDDLPDAPVLCNPQLGDCPSKSLAGVGVAFFLMAELNNLLADALERPRFDMKKVLDLVALGTLADMVPLEGQNRILVKKGLESIAQATRPGISELKVVSKYPPLAELGAGQVVFHLAPRINAAGRMAGAQEALELCCATDTSEAADRARRLDALNSERRNEEERILEEALAQAELQVKNAGLVVAGDSWNPGVIGIVASRIVEAHYRPTLVLCRDGDAYKGSGRSIHEFDLYAGLTECADILDSFGGHRMAAGLRVRPERLEEFRQRFNEAVLSQLGEELPSPSLILDGELDFAAASDPIFLKELELMEPFGIGNPEPVFSSPPLLIRRRSLFGPQKNHVKLELYDESCGKTLYAKAWRQADNLPSSLEGQRVRLAYSPSIDRYNGIANVDVRIRDMEFLQR